MNAQTYSLNIVPGYGITPAVKVSQDDVGRPLAFNLFDGANALSITSGTVITIHGTKPSGLGFSETCTWSGSMASISTTEAMTQEAGNILTELSLSLNDTVIGTANFVFTVEPTPHSSNTTDGTTETMASLQNQIGTLSDLATSDQSSIVAAINEVASSGGGSGTGLSEAAKTALLACFAHVAWDGDDGQTYYNALATALGETYTVTNNLTNVTSSNAATSVSTGTSYTATLTANSGYTISSVTVTMGGTDVTSTAYSSGTVTISSVTGDIVITATATADATVSSISAVYTQSGTVYDTDALSTLKSDLVVTATYDDSTTATVASTDYTLSGTLTEGTSTVTVTYSGQTTTFTVTVTASGGSTATAIYDWDFTSSMTDSVGGITATTNGTQDSSGITFSAMQKYVEFPSMYANNRTYEIDVTSILKEAPSVYGRLFMIDSDSATNTGGSGYILTGTKKGGDLFYMNGSWESNVIVSNSTDADGSYYDGSTLGFYIDSSGYISVYKDGTLLGTSSGALSSDYSGANVYIGSSASDALNNSVFTGFRIYEGNKYA